MNDQKEDLPLSIVSPNNVEHYVWGDSCDGWHLVLQSDLSVIEECVPAGASEVRHYHQKAQQFSSSSAVKRSWKLVASF